MHEVSYDGFGGRACVFDLDCVRSGRRRWWWCWRRERRFGRGTCRLIGCRQGRRQPGRAQFDAVHQRTEFAGSRHCRCRRQERSRGVTGWHYEKIGRPLLRAYLRVPISCKSQNCLCGFFSRYCASVSAVRSPRLSRETTRKNLMTLNGAQVERFCPITGDNCSPRVGLALLTPNPLAHRLKVRKAARRRRCSLHPAGHRRPLSIPIRPTDFQASRDPPRPDADRSSPGLREEVATASSSSLTSARWCSASLANNAFFVALVASLLINSHSSASFRSLSRCARMSFILARPNLERHSARRPARFAALGGEASPARRPVTDFWRAYAPVAPS